MTQVFLIAHTELARLEPPCDVGESSVPLQIPASDRKAIPFLMKHHYCKPLLLGKHLHPNEDRAAPGKENRSPEGVEANSSLPELLGICSPVSMCSERTEKQEGGGMIQDRAALSDSHLLEIGTGRMIPSCPKLHAVNGSWMLLIRNELLQQQLKPLTCKM